MGPAQTPCSWRGRSLGLLAQASLPWLRFNRQQKRNRVPTSGLEPLSCSLRVMTQALQRFARACKTRISRRLSLLRVAACCTVLRSRWCQNGVNITLVSRQRLPRISSTSFFARQPRTTASCHRSLSPHRRVPLQQVVQASRERSVSVPRPIVSMYRGVARIA
jgi:hypothetical protein